MLVVLHVRQIYNIVHASTEVHEEASNDWLFVSSWNKVWTIHRFNKLQANKLPKIKNIYIELACRPWCNAVAYPSGANCQAKMISQWVHGWTANLHITLQMTAVTKDHEVCWVKCNVPSPFLVTFSLVHRPLPDLSPAIDIWPRSLHGCEIKSGSGLGTRLLACIHRSILPSIPYSSPVILKTPSF